MKKNLLSSRVAPNSRSMGPFVRQVIPSAAEHVDPFVFLDHFGPLEKKPGGAGVPPHPHAGIATITYLFEGSNRHQDSYGHDAMVYAGDLAWMQAGKGIIHAEGMNENRTGPEQVHGLQFWISLPAKDKFAEPDFFHYSSEELPKVTADGIEVKVISGQLQNVSSPVKSLSPAYMFEIKLKAGEVLNLPIQEGDSCGVYTINGKIKSENHLLMPLSMTQYSTKGDAIALEAEENSHIMVFGGTPLNEPIVGYASYVMNSEEQIMQVMRDYQQGKMGELKI